MTSKKRSKKTRSKEVLAWHFLYGTVGEPKINTKYESRLGDPIYAPKAPRFPGIGKWARVVGPLRVCGHGLHASRRLYHALSYSGGENQVLSRVACRGVLTRKEYADKFVCRERKALWVFDPRRVMHAWALQQVKFLAKECVSMLPGSRRKPMDDLTALATGAITTKKLWRAHLVTSNLPRFTAPRVKPIVEALAALRRICDALASSKQADGIYAARRAFDIRSLYERRKWEIENYHADKVRSLDDVTVTAHLKARAKAIKAIEDRLDDDLEGAVTAAYERAAERVRA